jgi:hypothetical protein
MIHPTVSCTTMLKVMFLMLQRLGYVCDASETFLLEASKNKLSTFYATN